ncbi:VOC family protein [candidate division WOR-3 bacterium]|nr:VOC family protein [candidate division WOR-3 bacterium]
MPEICVVQFNVSDMDEALDFYCSKLGFEVKKKDYEDLILLDHEGVSVLLCKVDKPHQIDYPKVAQTVVNFKVRDLRKEMADLKAKGVEFIHSEPQQCPVGIYAAIRDPFGNVHELVEFGGTIEE